MKTLAQEFLETASKPAWFRTLSPSQREGFARWIIERLSASISKAEIIEILRVARKLASAISVTPPSGSPVIDAPKRGRGRPDKSAFDLQALRELEIAQEINPGMTKADAITMLMNSGWAKRFGEDADIERRLRRAKRARAARAASGGR